MKVYRKKERAYCFEDLDPEHVREIEMGLRTRKQYLANNKDNGKHEVQKSVDSIEKILEELAEAQGKPKKKDKKVTK